MLNIIFAIKRNRKRLLFYLLLIFLLVAVIYLNLKRQQKLEVDFLNVGQGDSSLIKTANGQVVMIDGGPDDLVLHRLGEKLPFYRRQIDLIILSHYHDDHITGLLNIIKRFRVNKIVYAFDSLDSPILQELFAVAKQRDVQLIALENSLRFSFDKNCSLNLLNPTSLGIKSNANNSLVAKFACQGKTFLFSGDNSELVEKALVKANWDLTAEVFKASHHGSDTANSEDFLKFVKPDMVVVSVGIDNKFGHPSPEVLDRLDGLGISYKRTDRQGNISIISP